MKIEIKRHEIDITRHAIDRCSTRCWRVWRKNKKRDEGIYSWLQREVRTILKRNPTKPIEVKDKNLGMEFVFIHKPKKTVLVTVYRTTNKYYPRSLKPKHGKNRAYILRSDREGEIVDSEC